MNKALVIIIALATSFSSFGKTVSDSTAQTVAYNFIKAKMSVPGATDLALAYTGSSVQSNTTVADFYVFNITSAPGFVIVAADDNVTPVLGYSTESGFTAGKMNATVQSLLTSYENQVAYTIQNSISAPAQTTALWTALLAGNAQLRSSARTTTTTVAPMLPTLWDQENDYAHPLTYNADCPYDAAASPAGQTLTGCVATAMSQVMKYWNWPDTGAGSNTYTQSPNPDGIPAQTANFAIAYHFDSMRTPSLTAANAYVATLMYNAGVSVDMNYGTDAEGGSGAYVTEGSTPRGLTNCAEYALNTYWRYPAARGYQRRHFTQSAWIDSMVNEMSAARPVIYAGDGSAGGHCWVIDGFDNDTFFHCNWGWGGYLNGNFTLNALNPLAGDTFNNDQEAIIRIIADTPANYSSDTSTKVVTSTTGVTPVNAVANSVLIYPNPATNTVNVSFEGILATEITITDMGGRTLQQFTNANAAVNAALPVNDLPNGMYLLRLQTDQGIITRKFVVAR